MRLLALGDIVGRPGRQVVQQKLASTGQRTTRSISSLPTAKTSPAGPGITQNLFHKLRSYGVDVVTLGDHAFRKNDIFPTMASSERLVRPANFSADAAGRGWTVVTTNGGVQVAVFVVIGRIFMTLPSDDPFAAATRVLGQIPVER